MAGPRISYNGREYDGPESMPPDVRFAYEEAMRQAAPALTDCSLALDPQPGLRIENKIIVNGRTYQSLDQMPPDVRQLYDDVMGRKGRESGVVVTRRGPTFAFTMNWSLGRKPGAAPGSAPRTPGLPQGPRPIEPSSLTESSLHRAIVWIVLAVGLSAAWVLLKH